MSDDIPDIHLEALDDYLTSDLSPENCMMLSDLDGFVTAIAIGPEFIPPSEWLPIIWGGDEPEFESERHKRTTLDTIIDRYNEIVATIGSDPYSFLPIFYEGPEGDVIVTDWAAGFLTAVKLRWAAWRPLLENRHAKLLLKPLLALGDDEDFRFEHDMPTPENEFYEAAPDLIAKCVAGIDEFWKERRKRQSRGFGGTTASGGSR